MASLEELPAYRIDAANMCVWRRNGSAADERLDLPPRTFGVLRYLVENEGRLVSHDELLTVLWGDVHVQPEVLKSHILAIRTLLGDKSAAPRFIETKRGRGYRFIGAISGLTQAQADAEAAAAPRLLVGRDEPLQRLLTSFDQAAAGERQVVFVSGEPGVGKTSLVQAVIAKARTLPGLVVAHGQCIEGFGGIEPYYPVLDALGSLCAGPAGAAMTHALMRLAPAWAEQMAELRTMERRGTAPLPIDVARSRMVREGTSLFEALAADRPLLLVLEDLHWSDFATVDLLSALCRRRTPAKLMLVATYRGGELAAARHPLRQMVADLAARKYCAELALQPLPRPAVGEILAGGPDDGVVDPDFVTLIAEHSGGNPLFIELILEFLQFQGLAERSDGRWRLLAPVGTPALATPPTLGRIVEATIDQMAEPARRIIEAASVAGARFNAAMAASAAQTDAQTFETICEAVARHSYVIRADELVRLPRGDLVRTYVFRHAVVQRAVYDRIGPSRRALLHRAVGERLEEIYPPDKRDDVAMSLARHFAAAQDWLRALDYLRSALRIANRRFARRDGLAILDQATEFAANLPADARAAAELELLERRGAIEAAMHDSKARDTYAALARKAREGGNVDVECRALLDLAYVASWTDLAGSRLPLDQALALSEQQSDPSRRDLTRVIAYVRRIWSFGWNIDDARRCEEALDRLRNGGAPLHVARAELYFAMICVVSTRYREAYDLADAAYSLLSETHRSEPEADVSRAFWIRHVGAPWARYALGELGAASKEIDRSIASFEESGDLSAARSFRVYRATLRFYAMDFEGVLQDCALPAPHSSTAGGGTAVRVLPVEHRIALIFGGLAKAGLGDSRGAREALQAAASEMERAPAHLDWYWRLPLEWGLVNLCIATGDLPMAQRQARDLGERAMQTADRMWQALAWEARSRAALASGEVTAAIGHIANAIAASGTAQAPLAALRVQAAAAMVYGAAGDRTLAARHAREGQAVRARLAESLEQDHPLRALFERCSSLLFGP